jgi:repressor LexA
MKEISAQQRGILTIVKRLTKEKGYPPTIREIAKVSGHASTSTVHGYLDRLEKRGLIYRDPTKPRAITIYSEERMYG